jgi:hypothetical protein
MYKWLGSWVRRDRWNPVWICRHHPARLNTLERPIVNQYREGKVKRTARAEWKDPETVRLQAVGASSDVTTCLLHNEPTSYFLLPSLRTSGLEAKRKRVWIGRIGSRNRRETEWSTLDQVEGGIVSLWRTELVNVEKFSDELRVGVKG